VPDLEGENRDNSPLIEELDLTAVEVEALLQREDPH
jgi:hypothetical protein